MGDYCFFLKVKYMNLDKIGLFIMKLRKEKGFTQNELGNMLNISGKAVSKWERGICAPDISLINDLSNVLGISPTELLAGKKLNIDADKIKKGPLENLILVIIKVLNKNKIIKTLAIFVFIIISFIVTFSIIYTISNYNRCSTYNLYSNNYDFEVDGIIIINNKNSFIMLNKIRYINFNNKQDTFIDNIKVILKIGNNNFLIEEKNFERTRMREILNNITIYINDNINPFIYNIKLNEISDLKIILIYNDELKIENIIEIPLTLNKLFSNNKLFY